MVARVLRRDHHLRVATFSQVKGTCEDHTGTSSPKSAFGFTEGRRGQVTRALFATV